MTQRRPTVADLEAGLQRLNPGSGNRENTYERRIARHLQFIIDRERAQLSMLEAAEAAACTTFNPIDASMSGLGLAIRNGDVAITAALINALKRAALARVAIDNPRYATYLLCSQDSGNDMA